MQPLRVHKHISVAILFACISVTASADRGNAQGDTSAQAAQRRGEIIFELTRLQFEDQTLLQATKQQILAMGSVGTLNQIDQRETYEGVGSSLALAGLSGKGVSASSLSARINALKGAIEEVQATAAAAKAEAQAVAKARVDNNASADMAGLGGSASRDFKPGTTQRAENINAGQVTDRDGLPRIDDDKIVNDKSQGLNQWDWPTQRPAWKEGTAVTDRITTQPETYRMVVNEADYRVIEDALDKGQIDKAVQRLGGWATKDTVTSTADVRGKLAISSEWKGQGGQDMHVIEFTARPGVGVREGTVGPMFDAKVETTLPGGGHQVQFMDKSPRTNPELYQINLSNSRKLK